MNAKKKTYGRDEALALLVGATKLCVMKGQNVQSIDLVKNRPSDDDLAKVMLGPTGNLRAPTIRKGKTLLVGFHGDTYADLLT